MYFSMTVRANYLTLGNLNTQSVHASRNKRNQEFFVISIYVVKIETQRTFFTAQLASRCFFDVSDRTPYLFLPR